MLSVKKLIIIISLIILIANLTFADWKDDAKVIDISGGEDHTLVLTQNGWPWGCGHNGFYQLGIGYTIDPQKTLIRVHGGGMGTTYLQDIDDVDAGWKHSLALDISGFVWANTKKYP